MELLLSTRDNRCIHTDRKQAIQGGKAAAVACREKWRGGMKRHGH